MDWKKIILICAVFCMVLFVSSVTASSLSTSQEKFVITPWYDYNEQIQRAAPIYGTITDGDVVEHVYSIPSGKTSLEVSLEWNRGLFQNDLSMRLISPSNVAYGPFDDSFEGIVNGVIPVTSQGAISSGTWKVLIYGTSVVGTQTYTLRVNAL
mgnify:CR=1 FL=1